MIRGSLNSLKRRATLVLEPGLVHLGEIVESFHVRLGGLRRNRSAELGTPLEKDFSGVLDAWGISPERLPGVLTELRIRLAILALAPVIPAIPLLAGHAGPMTFLAAIPFLAAGAVGALTTLWRIRVLELRRFIPFRSWLLAPFGFK